MNPDEFRELTAEIVTEAQSRAIYVKLCPFLEQVDDLVLTAQYAFDQWIAGSLTRMNGISALVAALNAIED